MPRLLSLFRRAEPVQERITILDPFTASPASEPDEEMTDLEVTQWEAGAVLVRGGFAECEHTEAVEWTPPTANCRACGEVRALATQEHVAQCPPVPQVIRERTTPRRAEVMNPAWISVGIAFISVCAALGAGVEHRRKVEKQLQELEASQRAQSAERERLRLELEKELVEQRGRLVEAAFDAHLAKSCPSTSAECRDYITNP